MKNNRFKHTASFVLIFTICFLTVTAHAQSLPDSTADIVLGQPDFATATTGLSQQGMSSPVGVAIDTFASPNILWVSDLTNNRILGFNGYPDIANYQAADYVIGQPDYVTGTSGATATNLYGVYGITFDASGNLWVADQYNNRVLVFISPSTTDLTADYVLGQAGSFTSATANNGGIGDSTFSSPSDVAFDAQSRLYVADRANNRILIFNDPLGTDFKADYVIGQPDFVTATSSTTDSTLSSPYSCTVDASGNLYICDYTNHRVLKFDDPVNTDSKADQVFGQAGSYTTATANNPSTNAESLNNPNGLFAQGPYLYVTDDNNSRMLVYPIPGDTTAISVYGQNGLFTTSTPMTTATGLNRPNKIVVDNAGRIVIADASNNRVLIYLPAEFELVDSVGWFGAVRVDSVAQKGMITIENEGGSPGEIQSVMNSGPFTIVSPALPVTVAPDSSVTFIVEFSPVISGENSGMLTFMTNDPANPTLNFEVYGTGTEPLTGYLSFVEYQKDDSAGVNGMMGVSNGQVSPDGKHFYVAGYSENAVAVFSRNQSTGALTWIEMQQTGVGTVTGLTAPNYLEISPDGKHVYVTAVTDNSLVVFSRDPATGMLTFVNNFTDDVSGVAGLAGATGIAVSPDGANVYVAGPSDNGIAVFGREACDSTLTYINHVLDDSADVTAITGVYHLAVSPDGKNLYASGPTTNSIAVFDRNYDGTLTFNSYVKSDSLGVGGLWGVQSVIVSADGKNVYGAGSSDNAIAVFSRNTSTGELTYVNHVKNDSAGVTGIANVHKIEISPEGHYLFAPGVNSQAFAVFERSTETGELSFIQHFTDDSAGVSGIGNPYHVTVSPDAKNIYVSGNLDNAVAVFKNGFANAGIAVTPPMLYFNDTDVGNSNTVTLWITNSAADSLFVDSVHVLSAGMPSGNSFTVLTQFDTVTANPLDTMFVDVQFNPVSGMTYNDSLIIFHRKGALSATETISLYVTGTGQTAVVNANWPPPDSTADVVIGQADFVSSTSGVTQTNFENPYGIAIDTLLSPNVLYISDLVNHRILGYYNYPYIQTNHPADFVIGQSNFVSNTTGAASTQLQNPYGIAVDQNSNLWVADYNNNRVLVFISPTTTDYVADYVFGQGGSFTTATANNGGVSDSSLSHPTNIAFDQQGRAYISDRDNHRILIYNDPLNTDRKADYVIGQPDFTSSGTSVTDSTLNQPGGCVIDPGGDLFVADYMNARVLRFIDPVNTDKKADQVFGQAGSFATNTVNNPAVNAESINNPLFVNLDKSGNLYISDTKNNRLLVYQAPLDTTADYVYGQNGSFSTNTTAASQVMFNNPENAVVDNQGNLIVADEYNHRVLIFKATGPADIFLSHPEGISFGGVDTALVDTVNLIVRNSGSDSLFIDSVRFASTGTGAGLNFSVLDSVDTVRTVPPDSMVMRTLFSPDSMLSYSDSLFVYYRIQIDSAASFAAIPLMGQGFLYGDVSGDFSVTAFDASLVLQNVVGLHTLGADSVIRAEISSNGTVGAFDASLILRHAAGFITQFPVEQMATKQAQGIPGFELGREITEIGSGVYGISVSFSFANDAQIFSAEAEFEHPGLEFARIAGTLIHEGALTGSLSKESILKAAFASTGYSGEEQQALVFRFTTLNPQAANDLKLLKFSVNEAESDVEGLMDDAFIPKQFRLHQNYPNPFNPVTTIKYDLPAAGKVVLKIYNVLGQEIKTLVDTKKNPGYYKLRWNGLNSLNRLVASGVYFYRIHFTPDSKKGFEKIHTKKLVFLK